MGGNILYRRIGIWLLLGCLFFASSAQAARIKDIAKVQGVRNNQLIGYGIIVGLNGTGDSTKSDFTIKSVINMMQKFGLEVDAKQIKPKNVAAVMVTAKLPAFAKEGDGLDINVASVGDAKSLEGGVLLQTPLRAANGQVYAVGQGPLSIGGYLASAGGNSQQKNFPTTGIISNGAIVEQGVQTSLVRDGSIKLSLLNSDFTTANRVARAINSEWGNIAIARDASTVEVEVPSSRADNLVSFIASIEDISISPDQAAKIVLNERTGTIVMGANVSISEVAVSQGGLTVTVNKDTKVYMPPSFSTADPVEGENTTLDVQEKKANLVALPATAKVGDVVAALNTIGATPRDIMAILEAMRAAGALHAEIELI